VQAFYAIRSERQLMEQLDYNRLCCWFVGCRRTIRSGTRPASRRPRAVERQRVYEAHEQEPSSDQVAIVGRALSVDGTLIEAWAYAFLSAHAAVDGYHRLFPAKQCADPR
jgi:hypothetical protein